MASRRSSILPQLPPVDFSRLGVFRDYAEFKVFKKMDPLAIQQVFLKRYFTENEENYRKLKIFFIYHGIGSGKTCTSITLAKAIMDKYPNMKTSVITPKRVQGNFLGELATCPPTKGKDTSNFKLYSFNDFMSKFKSKGNEDTRGLRDEIQKFTENKVILIDEAHNLISRGIDPGLLKTLITSNSLIPENVSGGIQAIALRLLTRLAHPTCKIFLLSATPIFDNKREFFELVFNLCPEIDDRRYIKRNDSELNQLAPYLKGKISYYIFDTDTLDDFNYPSSTINNLKIQLSATQLDIKAKLDQQKQKSFYSNERQMSISTLEKVEDVSLATIKETSPKINSLIDYINNDGINKGKHFIYVSSIQKMNIIVAFLLKSGFTIFNQLLADETIVKGIINKSLTASELNNKTPAHKRILIYDTSLSKAKVKQEILTDFLNSPKNIDGNIIKIIIGTPLTKEGLTFKHVQHFHLLDPVWNYSTMQQIEGRCIRYQSHKDITDEIAREKSLSRSVRKNIYIATTGNPENKTADEKIYELLDRKREIVEKLLDIIKKYSVDYYLYRKTEADARLISLKSKSSPIRLLSLNGKREEELEEEEEPEEEEPEEEPEEGEEEEVKKPKGNLIKLLTCDMFKKGKLPDATGNCDIDYKLGKYYGESCCIHKSVCKKPPNSMGMCIEKGYTRLLKKYDAIDCCEPEKKGITKTSFPTLVSKPKKEPKIRNPEFKSKRGRPPNILSTIGESKRGRGRPRKVTLVSMPSGV